MQTPTASQWEAIRPIDRHLLVAAGAGTGKTSTVVGRILYLLGIEIRGETCPAPLALRDIGAITYTNAAAADLKRKLREELRACGRRDLAYGIDAARIGTIHGFCGDILREFALRGGRRPGLRVLEEDDALALAAEAVHETVLRGLAERTVEALDALFAAWPVAEVEGWVRRLVGESARLERIASGRAGLGPLERTVVELALQARDELHRRLHEAGAVDFDRMIVWTRDLLRGDPLVRRTLQRRLRTLIVDEFQDVDPAQREIAYLLGEPESRRDDTTRLMLVGDPKQSIYRFRRADVTVWREVEDDFARRGLGCVVALDDNFRSVEPVLAFVDATVGPILDRPIDGRARRPFEAPYRSVKATPDRLLPPDAPPSVELLFVVPEGGVKPNAETIRAAEAEAVARRAGELHEVGVAWRDMAVLLASWSSVEIYERALRRAGVPTYTLRGEGFHRRREVLDLVLALETLRDPRDDRALVGFLRSPFVGLRDETLLAIARQADQPYWDYLHLVEVNERPLLEWGRELIAEHAALRDRIPTDRLLEALLERSGYLAHLHALGPEADQAVANVRKFLRLARQSPAGSVGDFLRAIREARERSDREGNARLYGEGEDVLTVTSVHSAKGLEWTVVFWCDLLGKPPAVHGDLLVGRDRIVLKDPERKVEEQPLHYRSLRQEEEAEQCAERKRLWYVAATRARDRLILSGLCPAKAGEQCPGGAILKELGEVPVGEDATARYVGQGGKEFRALVRTSRLVPTGAGGGETRARGAVGPLVQGDGRELLPRPLPAPIPPLAVPVGRARHSATELMVYARCAQRHWFRYVAGLREPPVDRSGPGFMSAIARGQIVHDVLEHLTEESELERLLEPAIGRWDPAAPPPEQPAGREYRRELEEEIRLVADHPDYRVLASDPRARRELAFLYLADPGLVAEGKIDLAAAEGDGLALLDVKTYQGDAESARLRAEEYALQRELYVAAVEAIGGRPVGRFAFQFSRARVQVSTPVTDELRRRGRQELVELGRGVGLGAPAMTRHPAECRFCGYGKVGWCPGVPERGGAEGSDAERAR